MKKSNFDLFGCKSLLGLSRWLSGKESACNAGDASSIPGSDPLEKEMATQWSILAWEIPWTEEPGGLQSTGVPNESRHNLGTTQQQKFVSSINNKQSFIPNNRK